MPAAQPLPPAEATAPITELYDPAVPVALATDEAPTPDTDAPTSTPNTAEESTPRASSDVDGTPDLGDADQPRGKRSDSPGLSASRGPAAAPQPAAAPPPAAGNTSTPPPASMPPTPTAAGSAAPTAAPAGAAAPSPSAALGETIRLAASQNFSRARLTLKPAELGGVEVLIAARGDGLAASLVAETPEAARLLESAGAELRRRLETHGLELHALYVSVAQDGPAGSGERRGEEDSVGTGGNAGGPSNERESSTKPTRTIELGGGVLIDVLA